MWPSSTKWTSSWIRSSRSSTGRFGARAPLDFTAATNPTGLRWRVPYLLLDAVIGAALGRSLLPSVVVDSDDDSDEEGEDEDQALRMMTIV